LTNSELKPFRRDMQIIFQDPFSSLDPRTPIGDSIAEGLRAHGMKNGQQRFERVLDIMRTVGLEDYHARRYPHEFSGGQRQRIGIARALILRPKFIVCDEPVSALDVSIQSQVLNLLRRLQHEFSLTYLFVAHNMSVVEHISDRVAVMYLGKIVELTDRETFYRDPQHPYTQALMSAIPVPNPALKRRRVVLAGDVPSPLRPLQSGRAAADRPGRQSPCRVSPATAHVTARPRCAGPDLAGHTSAAPRKEPSQSGSTALTSEPKVRRTAWQPTISVI
jgi:peptide/nickel transport system ATP-binding protein/oligopeptide transport system ATP-binding protein